MSHLSHGWYSRYVICCITSWHMVCDISICIVLADLVDFSWDEMSWVTWMFLYGPCPLGLRRFILSWTGLEGCEDPSYHAAAATGCETGRNDEDCRLRQLDWLELQTRTFLADFHSAACEDLSARHAAPTDSESGCYDAQDYAAIDFVASWLSSETEIVTRNCWYQQNNISEW